MTTQTLTGKTFVITGTLSVPRTEFARLLEDAGGKVVTSVSAKTTALVVGDGPGDAKVHDAELFRIPRLSETMARMWIAGTAGMVRVGINIQKVYGSSDDLVELEGCVRDELQGGDEPTYVRFTNGTYAKVVYSDEGVWRVEVIAKGTGTVRRLYGLPDDSDGDLSKQAHGDPDAPSYSDVLIIESDCPIELESWGRKPLKSPAPGLATAKRIIDVLDGFGGFDRWWHDIDQDDKTEILEAIAKVVEAKP